MPYAEAPHLVIIVEDGDVLDVVNEGAKMHPKWTFEIHDKNLCGQSGRQRACIYCAPEPDILPEPRI